VTGSDGNPGEESLTALRSLWQRTTPQGAETSPIDPAGLRATLRRRRDHVRLMSALDALATVAALAAAAWVAISLPGAKWLIWVLFISLLAVGTMARAMHIRRRVWSVDLDADVATMIRASIAQLEASLAITRLTLWVVAAAFAFLLPWGIWDFATAQGLAPEALRRRAAGYALAIGYGLIFAGVTMFQARRRRRELARWEATAAALHGDGTTTPGGGRPAPR
jgi:hypothetical protein